MNLKRSRIEKSQESNQHFNKVSPVKLFYNPKQAKTKNTKNIVFRTCLFFVASISLLFVLIMVIWIIFEASTAFTTDPNVSSGNSFLFGNYYDGVNFFASGFMVINSLWVSFLAIIFALPISILTALFVTRMVKVKAIKSLFIGVITILAAIPSVLYGAFGSQVIDTFLISSLGLQAGTTLCLVITLGFMIMPTITLVTTVTINAVDKKMENSSLALGASRAQTSFLVTVKAASGGILTGALLGIGRALGEATAVSMIAAQPQYGPTFNLIGSVRMLTATMLSGFLEVSPGTLAESAIFAQALLLLILIIVVFWAMKWISKKYDMKAVAAKEAKNLRFRKRIFRKANDEGVLALSPYQRYKYKWFEYEQNRNLKHEKHFEKVNSRTNFSSSNFIKSNIHVLTKWKKRKTLGLNLATLLTALVGVALLVGIITFLFMVGSPSLTWQFITDPVNGIKIPLFMSIFMILLTLAFLIPLGVMTGVYFAEYSSGGRVSRLISNSIDLLAGIPSLIFGLIGALIFLPYIPSDFKSLAGALTVTFVILPTMIKSTENALRATPIKTKEASLSLGATKAYTTWKVSLPNAFPQIISGVILSTGRVLAESAAFVVVLGTLSYASLDQSIQNGGVTLATYIWKMTSLDVVPWDQVCATGVIILSLILLIFLLALYIEERKWTMTTLVLFSIILILAGIWIDSWPMSLAGLVLLGVFIIAGAIYDNRIKFRILYQKFIKSRELKKGI